MAVDANYNLMKTQLVIITIMQCHLDVSTRFLLAVEKILLVLVPGSSVVCVKP